jgi:hypothetical protein
MVYSWLLKTNLSDASESPNPCTQALQGQKVSRQARRIRGFWVNVSEYSLEWHEHRTTMWQCECWGELDAYLFFCVFLVEFACCLACFWVLTLCLFAFKLTPFLNSMIGVDGLDVVDMCWAAVRMYSGYSWRFLETSQCDVDDSATESTSSLVPLCRARTLVGRVLGPSRVELHSNKWQFRTSARFRDCHRSFRTGGFFVGNSTGLPQIW